MKKFISILLLGMFLILQSAPGYAFGSRGSYRVAYKGTPAYNSGVSQLADGLHANGINCEGNPVPSVTGIFIDYVTNTIVSFFVEDPTFGGNFWNVDLETCKLTKADDRLFFAVFGFGPEL